MSQQTQPPSAVLFVCHLNSIRSPMAEGLMKTKFGKNIYVQSCGLEAGHLDEFMVNVMAEKNIDMSAHEARTLNDLDEKYFDIVIAFTSQAGDAAKAYFDGTDTQIEVWPMPDPTAGSLDVRALLNNYRNVRDAIDMRLTRRFA